jgi:hypothetical protein
MGAPIRGEAAAIINTTESDSKMAGWSLSVLRSDYLREPLGIWACTR